MEITRGGLRQRLAAEDAAHEHESVLARYLHQEFAWGRMSPQQVQKIAAAAMDDVTKAREQRAFFRDLDFLSKIGNEGRHANNMHRDIMRKITSTVGLPPATTVHIPSKRGDSDAALALPHEMFAHLYQHHPDKFEKQFFPRGEDDVKSFWDQCKNAPNLKDSTAIKNLERSRAIPIGIHGDEVPMSGRGKVWCKMAVVFSWFSLLCPMLPTKESLLLIWACNPSQFTEGLGGTLDSFWSVLAWSFAILRSGRWPHRDHRNVPYARGSPEYAKAGKHIAGGWHCLLFAVCGDLDYQNKFLQMPHWASAGRPCGFCRCTRDGASSWKDFKPSAAWRSTVLSTNEWQLEHGQNTCPLFKLQNVTGLHVQPDLMHVKYLGYIQYFMGSVLYLLCYIIMPQDPLSNLKQIGLMVNRIQRQLDLSSKLPVSYFSKLSLFKRKTGFPKIKGKAGQIKSLVPTMAHIWRRLSSQDNAHHRRISLVFKLDGEIEKILTDFRPEDGYYAVPEAQARTIREKHNQMCQLMVMLEDFYKDEAKPLFNVVSKLHYACHLIDNANTLHPFASWCWKGEDFMQTSSVLLASSLRGRNDISATIKALDKYRYAMHLLWTHG